MMVAVQTSPRQLSNLLYGLMSRPLAVDCEISGLAIDSRRVRPGDCFLAYSGTHEDGIRYIKDAEAAGAAAVLVEQADVLPRLAIPVLGIPQLRQRVALIASRFYEEPARGMHLIAITGTNGKTTTAHLCAQAQRALFGRSGYFGTLGYGPLDALEQGPNTTPDPVTFQRVLAALAADDCAHVALEASSHALSQGRLDELPIGVAVFTGLGHDHLDYHGTAEAYGAAKQRLFRHPGLSAAVINLDDAYAGTIRQAVSPEARIYTFSLRPDGPRADVQARQVTCDRHGINMQIGTWQGELSLQSPLLGEFNAQNLLAALTALMASGVSGADAAHALSQAVPVRGRMELLGGRKGQPLVCVDYAHSPDSLERVLQALRLPGLKRLICVFGCGGDRDTSKRGPMGAIAERLADEVLVTSDNPRGEDPAAIGAQILAGMLHPARAQWISDRALAIRTAIALAGPDDLVLLAGKGHESTQTTAQVVISLDDAALARQILGEIARD